MQPIMDSRRNGEVYKRRRDMVQQPKQSETAGCHLGVWLRGGVRENMYRHLHSHRGRETGAELPPFGR